MKKNINLLVGPILFIMCCLMLPSSIFTDISHKATIGTITWMSYWWLTKPIDYVITAFLPIIVNSFIEMANMNTLIANYASETIFLILGGSILSISLEKTQLDKRISALFLSSIGSNYKFQIIYWFVISVLLSSILPNTITCAAIIPIAISMLKLVGENNIGESEIASKILLTIVYGTSIGGLLSPLGGAMNLVTVDYMENFTGEEYLYSDWVLKFLPIVLFISIINILFLTWNVDKNIYLGLSNEYWRKMYKDFDKMSKVQIKILTIFLSAIILAFIRPLYQDIFPHLKPAYVFVLCASLTFIIKDENEKPVMKWNVVQKEILWELMYIFASGLAIGTIVTQSGTDILIGNSLSIIENFNEFQIIFCIVFVTIFLSDLTSNTAAAALSIPIISAITLNIGKNPIPYIYIATIGINISYILPTSIRAIPIGYGMKPKYMFNEGIKITAITIISVTIFVYFLITQFNHF